jgi:uncharacterized protein (TIGR02285 family)
MMVAHRRALMALACLCFSHMALAGLPVIWLTLDGSPVRPHATPGAAQAVAPPGPGEAARRWLLDRLPAFSAGTDTASVARIERLIEDGSGHTYCYAQAIRTPKREAYALFSEPVLHRLPSRLIVRTDRLALLTPHLNAQGQLQLASLLKDPQLSGAVTSMRNYGPLIDAALPASKETQRVTDSNTPARMLMARRIDWVISEPADLAWFVQHEPNLPRTPTRSIEIAGTAWPVLTHVMCSRTTTGRQLLDELNRLMARHPDRPWERPYLDLLDAQERTDLARLMRAVPP